MTNFQVGDRVMYVGNDAGLSFLENLIGKVGTISYVGLIYTSKDVVIVDLDNFGRRNLFKYNLKLLKNNFIIEL